MERFNFAQKAALQGERDGLYILGFCFGHGDGCVQDMKKAKENYLLAAPQLGHVLAMTCYGCLIALALVLPRCCPGLLVPITL